MCGQMFLVIQSSWYYNAMHLCSMFAIRRVYSHRKLSLVLQPFALGHTSQGINYRRPSTCAGQGSYRFSRRFLVTYLSAGNKLTDLPSLPVGSCQTHHLPHHFLSINFLGHNHTIWVPTNTTIILAMPGALLPPSTLDPRWRNKLNLMLWVFAAEDGDPPHAYTKLSNLLATASKDLSEDVDGGKWWQVS